MSLNDDLSPTANAILDWMFNCAISRYPRPSFVSYQEMENVTGATPDSVRNSCRDLLQREIIRNRRGTDTHFAIKYAYFEEMCDEYATRLGRTKDLQLVHQIQEKIRIQNAEAEHLPREQARREQSMLDHLYRLQSVKGDEFGCRGTIVEFRHFPDFRNVLNRLHQRGWLTRNEITEADLVAHPSMSENEAGDCYFQLEAEVYAKMESEQRCEAHRNEENRKRGKHREMLRDAKVRDTNYRLAEPVLRAAIAREKQGLPIFPEVPAVDAGLDLD